MPEHFAVYVCSHVFDDTRPVLLVVREAGDLMLLCGAIHDFDADPTRLVGLSHLVARDPALATVADLPEGFEAERQGRDEEWLWSRSKDVSSD
jgi:hypothetical protein